MTPVDIEMKEFKKARFGGYNADDVNEFLDEVIRAFEEEQRENIALKQKITSLNENLDYYKTMETTLQNTMILAEKTSQETRMLAEEKAEQLILEGTFKSDQIVEKARQDVYTIKQSIDDLQHQYNSAKIQIKQMLQTQLEILDTQTISVEVFNTIPEETTEKMELIEEDYYTKEYQIINEEDAI
ncbi:MAG TPA: DivIVA domain-containing protein [Epulopiscium sp.]|nr:DivIVA domain-containing protein [Candidatus Epulonipiscium sp.]